MPMLRHTAGLPCHWGIRSEVWHWVIQGMSDPPFWGPVSLDDVHSLVPVDNGVLRWERHTEFWSVTFAGDGPQRQRHWVMCPHCRVRS